MSGVRIVYSRISWKFEPARCGPQHGGSAGALRGTYPPAPSTQHGAAARTHAATGISNKQGRKRKAQEAGRISWLRRVRVEKPLGPCPSNFLSGLKFYLNQVGGAMAGSVWRGSASFVR
jgi:hypothetical protein